MLRGFKRPLDRFKINDYINLIYTHKKRKTNESKTGGDPKRTEKS